MAVNKTWQLNMATGHSPLMAAPIVKQNGGAAYEDKLCKTISDCALPSVVLLPRSNVSSNTGVDVPLTFFGTNLPIEAKLKGAQMSGTSLRYDQGTASFTLVKEVKDSDLLIAAAKVKIPVLNAYIDALKQQSPPEVHSQIAGIPLKATRTARSILKAAGLQAACEERIDFPVSFLHEIHNKKGTYYIQIEGLGFFSLGGNPFNLPIPELAGHFRVEFRIGYAGGKEGPHGHVAHAGFRVQGRLISSNEKSPYSLDTPDHVRILFGKDWRV